MEWVTGFCNNNNESEKLYDHLGSMKNKSVEVTKTTILLQFEW